jgi:hypothetical protein
MVRLLFFFVLALLAAGAGWYLFARLSGRPFVSDLAGKILLALTIAGLAFWLFGGGLLMG